MYYPNSSSYNFHECKFNETIYWIVFHISACFSFPIYGLALFILTSSFSEFFKKYRKLLLNHMYSNILNDIFSTIIWLPKFHIPGMITCSLGVLKHFNVIGFIAYVTSLAFIAVSLIQLFHHNLNIAIIHQIKYSELKSLMNIAVVLMNVSYLFNLTALLSAYNGLHYQNDYKTYIHETTKVSELIFCEECFVPNLWSTNVKTLFIIGTINLVLSTVLIFTMALITYISLHFSKQIKSAKTLSIQKNFLTALIVQTLGHIGLLSIPLSILFSSVFFDLPSLNSYIYDTAFFISTQHGTFATIILFLTNKLLSSKLKEKFINLMKCQENRSAVLISSVQQKSRISSIFL